METKEKKQVVSAISKATNILVTVGVDPSVDELAALLGLSLVLGRLDKHATAVFSGDIPPAISFLEPDKTFEDTVDGLRDFIIALNKDKADHLRYKLDGDVVKIFITPYKNTIIRGSDLEFSQGDFNVELIVALGVENKADLDTAVASHGRILHDATTVSLSAGSDKSDLGEIDWHAGSASSLCEMLVSLARDLGENLIDEQIATALMTGIVSRTERFSNNLTTSDVMKTAATLMGLGANQQLIAARLEEARDEPAPSHPRHHEAPVEAEPEAVEADADGSMQINHEARRSDDEPRSNDRPSLADIERDKDRILQEELDKVIPSANVDLSELTQVKNVRREYSEESEQGPSRRFVARASYDDLGTPSMGGTLNATTEQAEEDTRAAIEDERNHVILSHDAPPANAPELPAPTAEPEPARDDTPAEPEEPVFEEPAPRPAPKPAPKPKKSAPTPPAESHRPKPVEPAPNSQESVTEALASLGYPAGSHPTLADLDQKTGHKAVVEVDDARAAVATALDSVFAPANNPSESINSQPLGEEVHTPELPPLAPVAPAPVAQAPVVAAPPVESPTSIDLPPLPPLPPLPGQAGELPPLPPLPELGELDAHASEHATPEPAGPSEDDWQSHTIEPPSSNDPGQFHIPGQK